MLPDITSQKVAIPAALFLSLSPGLLLTTDGSKISFMNRKTGQMAVFFHALVFFLVYSLIAKTMGIVLTKTDLLVTTALFLCAQPRSLPHTSPQVGWYLRIWSDEHRIRTDTRSRVRSSICDITSSISSILLSRKMKYLILGPASMGIFSLIGVLKARESESS